ncbi:MAG TPA: Fur family transcriptional regulator [Stellaceae bacterium]|nr:Fur family transcriptional regulator [Stellaceae bacterium]
MTSRLEQLCHDKGMKMTEQRRVIARVLSDSADHPDVEAVHRRAAEIDPKISIATVYRTVRLFQEANILERHDFGDGRARYEEVPSEHHDHLIDLQTGRVIEFRNEEIEALQREVAARLGYKLVDHRLELFAVSLNKNDDSSQNGKK